MFVYPNFDYAYHCIKKDDVKIDIFYNTAAKNHTYQKLIRPKLTIYHSCDSFEEWKKEEETMINLSDVVLCTSQFIYDLRVKQHDNVHLVRNGCNEEMINAKYAKMNEFNFIKKPLCTFSGACGKWVSTYHIRNVAKHYYTTFIGLAFGKAVPDNVIHYQAVDHKFLANFLYNMDLGLLPFNTKQEVTQAANPIKMWEYLACGLPVIATDWVETNREELKDVVFTPKTDSEYINLIKDYETLSDTEKENLRQKCFEVARKNT